MINLSPCREGVSGFSERLGHTFLDVGLIAAEHDIQVFRCPRRETRVYGTGASLLVQTKLKRGAALQLEDRMAFSVVSDQRVSYYNESNPSVYPVG